MKKNNPVYISFDIQWNAANDTRYFENWVPKYSNLTAQDAEMIACQLYNMRRIRFEKLRDHTSKKFNCMKTRKVMVLKNFNDSPVVYKSYSEQSREEVAKILKEFPELNPNLINYF